MHYFSNVCEGVKNYIGYGNQADNKDGIVDCFDNKQLLDIRIREINNTVDRFDELVSVGKWDPRRVNLCDFENLQKDIKALAQSANINDETIQHMSELTSKACDQFVRLTLNVKGFWSETPRELHRFILSFLGPVELSMFGGTSRRTYLYANDPVLWENLCRIQGSSSLKTPDITCKELFKKEDMKRFEGEVCLKPLDGRSFNIRVNLKIGTFGDLKELIHLKHPNLDIDKMNIIVSGKRIDDKEKVGPNWKNVSSGCGRAEFHLIMK